MVVAALTVWLLFTLIGQFRIDKIQRMRRLDLLHLIPQYNFFAPTPGTKDFHLLYRDQLDNETFTDWAEVVDIGPRRWWHAIWNPKRRIKKATFDLTTTLAKELQQYGPILVKISIPYLLTLSFVSQLSHYKSAIATQFLLMVSDGSVSLKEPVMLFLSDLHNL
jgi:hypothetical protein